MAIVRSPAGVGIQIGIIILTLATAYVHLRLALPTPFIVPLLTAFLLNGIGYLVLLGALYLPISQLGGYRNTIRILFIAYTALTVVLWIFLGARTTEGYIDKAIEVILIILLAVEARSAQQQPQRGGR